MKISILVPFHNEEKTLSTLIDELSKLSLDGIVLESVFVNDGSTDDSEKLVREKIKKKNQLSGVIVSNKNNEGKGAAIRRGLKEATGEYIIIQDADMEYHPSDIPKLLYPIQKGKAQVVFGTRLRTFPQFSGELRRPRFVLHYVGNRMLSLLTSVIYGTWITDMETGYKLFPKKAFSARPLTSNHFEIEPEITAKLLKSGFRIIEVPIRTVPRGYKEGKKLRTVPDGLAALFALIKYRFRD